MILFQPKVQLGLCLRAVGVLPRVTWEHRVLVGGRAHGHRFQCLVSYLMLRNSASGLEIGLPGLILAGLLQGKHGHRPSGRPKADRRPDFHAFQVAVRPKCGQEARFPTRKHHLAT